MGREGPREQLAKAFPECHAFFTVADLLPKALSEGAKAVTTKSNDAGVAGDTGAKDDDGDFVLPQIFTRVLVSNGCVYDLGPAKTTAAASSAPAPLAEKGDLEGHQFHGNQWTGGSGGTATVTETPEAAAARDYQEHGTRAKAFKEWFGDWEHDPEHCSEVLDGRGRPKETGAIPGTGSEVLDKDGQPMKVYHGTAHDWTVGDKSKLDPNALYGPGFYFTTNKDIADSYREKGNDFKLKISTEEGAKVFRDALQKRKDEIPREVDFSDKSESQQKIQQEQNDVASLLKYHRDDDILAADMVSAKWSQWLAGRGVDVDSLMEKTGVPATKEAYLNIRNALDMDIGHNDSVRAGIADAVRSIKPEEVADMLHPGDPLDKMDPESGAFIRDSVKADLAGLDRAIRPLFGPTVTGAYMGATKGEKIYDILVNNSNKSVATFVLQKAGFDGITHVGGDRAGGGEVHHQVYIAFEPEQVKAVANRGTFDPTSKDTTKGGLTIVVKGDIVGHEFHGNQWTGGGGQSVTPIVRPDATIDSVAKARQAIIDCGLFKGEPEVGREPVTLNGISDKDAALLAAEVERIHVLFPGMKLRCLETKPGGFSCETGRGIFLSSGDAETNIKAVHDLQGRNALWERLTASDKAKGKEPSAQEVAEYDARVELAKKMESGDVNGWNSVHTEYIGENRLVGTFRHEMGHAFHEVYAAEIAKATGYDYWAERDKAISKGAKEWDKFQAESQSHAQEFAVTHAHKTRSARPWRKISRPGSRATATTYRQNSATCLKRPSRKEKHERLRLPQLCSLCRRATVRSLCEDSGGYFGGYSRSSNRGCR